jgi:flavin reductase (DIM6/NTAB) family NADH-FMN oxidoreductase RutF
LHDHKAPFQSDLVDAPYIKEFPLILECKLLYTIEIGLHKQLIGEIVDVKVEGAVLGENGPPDVGKVVPFFLQPGDPQYPGRAHSTDRIDS